MCFGNGTRQSEWRRNRTESGSESEGLESVGDRGLRCTERAWGISRLRAALHPGSHNRSGIETTSSRTRPPHQPQRPSGLHRVGSLSTYGLSDKWHYGKSFWRQVIDYQRCFYRTVPWSRHSCIYGIGSRPKGINRGYIGQKSQLSGPFSTLCRAIWARPSGTSPPRHVPGEWLSTIRKLTISMAYCGYLELIQLHRQGTDAKSLLHTA